MRGNLFRGEKGLSRVLVFIIATLIILILAGGAGVAMYLWQKSEARKGKKQFQAQIKTLREAAKKLSREKEKLESRVDLLIKRLTKEGSREKSEISVSSSQGNIIVSAPQPGKTIATPATISGRARVFEAALSWQVKDASEKVIGRGSTTASAGAPEWGEFKTEITFIPPAVTEVGTIEVYTVSAATGEIDEAARVQVVLRKD